LLARGEKVRALVLPGENLCSLDGMKLEVVVGDILLPASLDLAFEGVEVVYHLAGMISILPGEDDLVQLVNVQGTRNVLEAARKAGIRRLVYTSSIHAIQRAPVGVVIDENLPFDPDNPVGAYDRSKAQATLAVIESIRNGLDAVIVCPTGVIGPFDFRGSEIGRLIEDCAENRPQLYIDGAYDFVDVRDVSQGLILACEKGEAGEVYILSGERVTVQQIMDDVQSATGRRFSRLKIPFWLARLATYFTPAYYRFMKLKPRFTHYSLVTVTGNSVYSNHKARFKLGFNPRPIAQSISDTVKWVLGRKKAHS